MSERAKRLCDCRVAPTMIAQGWESEMIGDVTGSRNVLEIRLLFSKVHVIENVHGT